MMFKASAVSVMAASTTTVSSWVEEHPFLFVSACSASGIALALALVHASRGFGKAVEVSTSSAARKGASSSCVPDVVVVQAARPAEGQGAPKFGRIATFLSWVLFFGLLAHFAREAQVFKSIWGPFPDDSPIVSASSMVEDDEASLALHLNISAPIQEEDAQLELILPTNLFCEGPDKVLCPSFLIDLDKLDLEIDSDVVDDLSSAATDQELAEGASVIISEPEWHVYWDAFTVKLFSLYDISSRLVSSSLCKTKAFAVDLVSVINSGARKPIVRVVSSFMPCLTSPSTAVLRVSLASVALVGIGALVYASRTAAMITGCRLLSVTFRVCWIFCLVSLEITWHRYSRHCYGQDDGAVVVFSPENQSENAFSQSTSSPIEETNDNSFNNNHTDGEADVDANEEETAHRRRRGGRCGHRGLSYLHIALACSALVATCGPMYVSDLSKRRNRVMHKKLPTPIPVEVVPFEFSVKVAGTPAVSVEEMVKGHQELVNAGASAAASGRRRRKRRGPMDPRKAKYMYLSNGILFIALIGFGHVNAMRLKTKRDEVAPWIDYGDERLAENAVKIMLAEVRQRPGESEEGCRLRQEILAFAQWQISGVANLAQQRGLNVIEALASFQRQLYAERRVNLQHVATPIFVDHLRSLSEVFSTAGPAARG